MRCLTVTESLSYLEWDSNFFNKRVGRLLLHPQRRLEAELDAAKQQGYNLIYIYSEFELEPCRDDEFSLLDVGGQVKYVKKPIRSYNHGDHNPCIVRYAQKEITPDVIELACLSGHLSRFRVDPLLPAGSFEKLYQTWIANTLDRAPMAAIDAYYVESGVVGIITSEWNKETCSIGLLAVRPSYQGLGIGTQLLKHVESLCAANSVSSIEVKTQLTNATAQAVYLKNSFLEAHRTFLYHAHLLPR